MKVFFVILLATVIVSVTLADTKPLWDSPREQNASVIPQSRIIEGTLARSRDFKFHLHLEYRSFLGATGSCGGVLIRSEWALTAAQCASANLLGIPVKHTLITVKAGILDLRVPAEQTKTVTTNNIHIPSDYNPNTLMSDIAALKTDSPFEFTPTVNFIYMVFSSSLPSYYIGVPLTISGFGYTTDTGPSSNVLLYTDTVLGISFADCQAQYSPRIIPTSSFCAQDTTSPISASCIGDSGGPVTITISGQKRLIGVVSYTSGDGCDEKAQGHTNLAQYIDWINQL